MKLWFRKEKETLTKEVTKTIATVYMVEGHRCYLRSVNPDFDFLIKWYGGKIKGRYISATDDDGKLTLLDKDKIVYIEIEKHTYWE